MIKPILLPYKAEHLLSFVDRTGVYYDVKAALEKEKGPAFTAMADNIILGCAGVFIVWPGMGIAWTVFSKEAEPYMLWCTRTIKKMLHDIISAFNLHRVELVVLEDRQMYDRWAECLGFSIEGDVARWYTSDKQNARRYEMITS